MLSRSVSIGQNCDKVVYVRVTDNLMAVSNGKNANGKWRIIDLCMGNTAEAIQDLQAQGYIVKRF